MPTGQPNKRLRQSVMDMVRSLAVVLGAVLVIGLLVWRPTTPTERVVDVTAVQNVAQAQAGFDVLMPRGPGDLEATSARWEPTKASMGAPVWHVGYVVDGAEYLQVSQARRATPALIDEQTAGGQEVGTQVVGEETWTRYQTPERRSLVVVRDGAVTVVSGTLDWLSLTTAAASLGR